MLLVLLGFGARRIRDRLLLVELRALVGVFVAASVLEGPATFVAVVTRAVLSVVAGSVVPAAVVAALEVTLVVAVAP